MVSPVDPNEVRLTGENSYIRLSEQDGGPLTTRSSHWRVLYSPAGPGHVLFIQSELTDNQVRIYADNIALTRWLQEEIELFLFPGFTDQKIPVVDALFSKSGDTMTYWTETVDSNEETIMLTWYDFGEPFVIRVPPGADPGNPLGVYSCLVPSRRAQLTVDGLVAKGRPFPEQYEDRTSSTSCLAWSETWVRPY
mgnify:CR=1 FL=1